MGCLPTRHRTTSDCLTSQSNCNDKVEVLIAVVRGAIERLREFRAALISAAVTGKIDVREEVA